MIARTHSRAKTFAAALAVASLAAALALAPAATAGKRANLAGQVNCNATALELLGINLTELLGNPCRTASGGIELPLAAANHIYVLRGLIDSTSATGTGGTSEASLLDLKPLADVLPIQLLRSSVYVTCRARKPVVSGGSATLGGVDVPMVPPLRISEPVQIGSLIFLNERVQEASGLTARALRVATPAGDIVLSEVSGGYTGNPCRKQRRR